jgi:curved DNA-binding protein CbpA
VVGEVRVQGSRSFTHYAVLGVAHDAAEGEIVRAFRSSAKRLHPDVSPDPGAHEEFMRAKAAYETLRDPFRRIRYDSALAVIEPDRSPAVVPPTVLRQRMEDGLIGASVSLAGVGLLYVLALLVAH